jgi:membrane protease YdiL (CAAX protease family)
MNRKLIRLGIILLIVGLTGVASILSMEVSIPVETEIILKEKFTDEQIKFLTLINPTIMLLVAVLVGTLLYQRVNLTVPLIEKMTGIRNESINLTKIFGYGVLGGVLSGVLLSLNGYIFNPILPGEFKALGETYQPTIAVRFLYGGLTEEILMRFGLMTLIVWIFSKILNNTKPMVYWIGIIIAAIIFAIGHFPVAYQAVGNPSPGLLTYILIGNSIGGVIFGWLYWKKGLESAFVAHIFAHVVMLLAMAVLN